LQILKALPQIQQQVDSLLEVDIQSIELGNGVINSAFVMLFKVTFFDPCTLIINLINTVGKVSEL
jgi:hypothetical protein